MTEDIHRKIEGLVETGYDFPVMDFFSNAFSLFKKAKGSFIGYFLLFMLITIFAGVIPVVGYLLNSFVVGPALLAGWYIFSDKLNNEQAPEFDSFFRGFDHLVQLMLVALTTTLIIFLILSPALYLVYKSGVLDWYLEIIENPLAAQEVPDFNLRGTDYWILLLNIIPAIYFSIAFTWAPLFVVFYGLTFWEAIEASRKLITRKWFSVFSFFLLFIFAFVVLGLAIGILVGALSVGGGILAFFLLIGATLVFVPVFYIAVYLSFAEVTGLRKEKADDIFDHLVD